MTPRDDPLDAAAKNAAAKSRVEQIKKDAKEKTARKKREKKKVIDDARTVGNSVKKGTSQN